MNFDKMMCQKKTKRVTIMQKNEYLLIILEKLTLYLPFPIDFYFFRVVQHSSHKIFIVL